MRDDILFLQIGDHSGLAFSSISYYSYMPDRDLVEVEGGDGEIFTREAYSYDDRSKIFKGSILVIHERNARAEAYTFFGDKAERLKDILERMTYAY